MFSLSVIHKSFIVLLIAVYFQTYSVNSELDVNNNEISLDEHFLYGRSVFIYRILPDNYYDMKKNHVGEHDNTTILDRSARSVIDSKSDEGKEKDKQMNRMMGKRKRKKAKGNNIQKTRKVLRQSGKRMVGDDGSGADRGIKFFIYFMFGLILLFW